MVTDNSKTGRLRRWTAWLPLILFELVLVAAMLLAGWTVHQSISAERNRMARGESEEHKSRKALEKYRALYSSISRLLESELSDQDRDQVRAVFQNDAMAMVRIANRLEKWTSRIIQESVELPSGKAFFFFENQSVILDPGNVVGEILLVLERYRNDVISIKSSLQLNTPVAERIQHLDLLNRHVRHLQRSAVMTKLRAETIHLPDTKDQVSNWAGRLILQTTLLVVLMILFGWLAVYVYRHQLTSLRQQLVVTRGQMDRQEKIAQKGRMASELAHELRNPLTAINIRLHSLAEALDDQTEQHRDLRLVRKEIRRLNAILEDFLHLDRAPQPSFSMVSSSVLLRDVTDLLSPLAKANGIQLNLDQKQDMQVNADPNQVKQVILNLVRNACESVEHDGAVTVRSFESAAKLTNRVQPVWVVEIQDTGPGIAPEVQRRLFEPFFSTKKTGTGLGLAIAERIIHQHGGAIDFETQAGQGTTFRVLLPLKQG